MGANRGDLNSLALTVGGANNPPPSKPNHTFTFFRVWQGSQGLEVPADVVAGDLCLHLHPAGESAWSGDAMMESAGPVG